MSDVQENIPDWARDDGPPAQVAAGDNVPDWARDTPDDYEEQLPSSASGAFIRGAAEGAVPAIGGGLGGAGLGAVAGSVFGPPGAIVGGLVGGLGAGYLTAKAQDAVIDKLGLRQGTGPLSTAQQQADIEQHPYARTAGSLASTLAAFGTNPEATLVQRGIGAAGFAGAEAAQEGVEKGEFDPVNIAMAALAGGTLTRPRGPLNAVSAVGERVGSSVRPNKTPGTPGRPDIQADDTDKTSVEKANDITTTTRGVAAENPPVPTDVGDIGNAQSAPSRSSRTYPKEASAEAQNEAVVTAPSEDGINMDDIHPDVVAALDQDNAKQPVTEGNGVAPAPGVDTAAPAVAADTGAQPGGSEQPAAPNNADNPAGQRPVPAAAQEQPAGAQAVEPATSGPQPPVGPAYRAVNVTPRVVAAALQKLGELGTPDGQRAAEALTKLFQTNSGAASAQASKYLAGLASRTGKAEGNTTVARMPTARPQLESGMTGRSKADVARKQGAIDAIKKAFAQFGGGQEQSTVPLATPDKQALVTRLQSAIDAATGHNNGVDPIKAYRPNVKPPEWQWLRAAQRVVAKPTPKNIKDFITAENLLKSGSPEAAKDVQDTGRINADIEKRSRPTVEQAELGADQEAPVQEREQLEEFTNPDQEESQRYTDDQNKLRTWVNGLGDEDYKLLADKYPDGIRQEVEATQDPEELLRNFQDDLSEAQQRMPGNKISEPVSPEDVPGVSYPVRNASDLDRFAETKPGAAASGEKLTPDAKAKLIAEYNAKLGAGEVIAPNREGRLESEEAAQKAPDAVKGTWGALAEKAKQFGADEDGAIQMPRLGGPMASWLTGKFKDIFDPSATPPEREYGEALDNSLHVLGQKHVRDNVYLRANALAAPDLTARQWQDGYRAAEQRDYSKLPREVSDAMKDHYDSVMWKLEQVYEDYRTARPELNLPKWTEGYVPRMRKGTAMDPTSPEEGDPILGIRPRTLSGEAPQFEDRQYFSAVDKNGKRWLFSPDEKGVTVFSNGKTRHYDAPGVSLSDGPDYVGKQFNIGKTGYNVDHARALEITQNVRGKDGKPLEFIENPVLAASNAYKAIKTAADNWKLVQDVANSKDFQKFSTTDKDIADKRGYVKIELPDKAFKGTYAAPPIARVLNDYALPGFRMDDAGVWRNANRALTKLIFSTPIPHALNEAQLWATQRGFNWLPGNNNYGRLVRTSLRALQSVNQQDYIQDQLAQSGASPMLGGALTHDLMSQIAEKMGLEVTKDAPRFDPVFKAFGISSKDMANWWYRNIGQKPMWWISDVLLTQQFLEHQELGQSLGGAAKESHRFISDYRLPTAIMPNVLPDRIGRAAAQALGDPSILMFGRYRAGIYRSVANMTKNMVSPYATKQERIQAAGSLMAAIALGTVVWPILSNGIKQVTGNEGAELNPAGLLREPYNIANAYNGENPGAVIRDALQPAPLIKTMTEAADWHDWKGDPITVPFDKNNPGKSALRIGGELADYGARQIAPIDTAESAVKAGQGGVGSSLGHLLASQSGVKLPSDRANIYQRKLPATIQKQIKQRNKRPQGPIEQFTNYLSR